MNFSIGSPVKLYKCNTKIEVVAREDEIEMIVYVPDKTIENVYVDREEAVQLLKLLAAFVLDL